MPGSAPADQPARLDPFHAGLDPLLCTSFVLSRLTGAATETAPEDRVFRSGLRTGELREARKRVRGIQAAQEEAARIRSAFSRPSKPSEARRKELRRALRETQRSIRESIRSLPLREKWVANTVNAFKRSCEEIEQNFRRLEEIGQRHNQPAKDLRRMLRQSGSDEAMRAKQADRLSLSLVQLDELDEELRRLGRSIVRQQDALEMPAQDALRLLAVVREWEASRGVQPAARIVIAGSRDSGRGVVGIDIATLEAQVDEIASSARVRSDVPTPKRAVPPPVAPRQRRVVFSRQGTSGTGEGTSAGATYSDLGRLGEAVVFAIMEKRWASAARAEPSRTADLLWRLLAECWAAESAHAAELETVLIASDPDTWLSSSLVRDLLWPARTPYGDAMGFDLFGLDESGEDWLCVEVKTTQGAASTRFELTANELDRARREGGRYVIARVANLTEPQPAVYFWRDPAALIEQGTLRLTPSAYSVSL